jgi:hypothetical protein
MKITVCNSHYSNSINIKETNNEYSKGTIHTYGHMGMGAVQKKDEYSRYGTVNLCIIISN